MRIRIEVNDERQEEVVVYCKSVREEILHLQRELQSHFSTDARICFYKGDTQYYLPIGDILFFETQEKMVYAHTNSDIYQVPYKLYELEELLPSSFLRVAKSTILNAKCVFSITRNLTASSIVEFQGTYKQVYVSRGYFKALQTKLKEIR